MSQQPALLFAFASLASWAAPSLAADAAAGKAAAQSKCIACHEVGDWEGEDAVSLESLIRDIVAGKIRHSKQKLDLTPEEIVGIAAYWGQGVNAQGRR